jgi:diguanylate cyclase (GGDEF)-like protein
MLACCASVWCSASDVPPDIEIEVLLTDLSADEAARRSGGDCHRQTSSVRARPAVVGIGSAAWADVVLPQEATPREIGLACGLVGEIARLQTARDEVARIQQQTVQLAETDPLTNLANRRVWDRQLQSQWTLASSTGQPLWLAIVDLDRFKEVNDRDGYAAGDRTLQDAAQALAGQLRRGDVIARLGGDEFAALLLGIGEGAAQAVFERLCSAMAGQAPSNSGPQVTASIGMAGGQNYAGPERLFAAAERALRDAKQAGGNRVCRAEK